MWLGDIKDFSRLRSVFVPHSRNVVGHRFAGSEWLDVSTLLDPPLKFLTQRGGWLTASSRLHACNSSVQSHHS